MGRPGGEEGREQSRDTKAAWARFNDPVTDAVHEVAGAPG
ncbi:hypothetical protein GCM10027456_78510 [Kineosporia babensis]